LRRSAADTRGKGCNQRGIANLFQQLRGDSSERLQAIFEARRSPRFKFDRIPLAHAIQAIANASEVPIEVNWSSFEKVSVTPDSPVTVDVKNAAPGRAVRALITFAGGRPVPLEIRATAREIEIACDDDTAPGEVTRVYNLQTLPARASGLDPTKPYTRAQALAALLGKIQDVLHSKALREVNGKVIVTAPVSIHLQITTLLDDLDSSAVAAAAR
jgi:hypothetical protein